MSIESAKQIASTIHSEYSYIVRYRTINEIINEYYGIDFEIAADLEMVNDTAKIIYVEKHELSAYEVDFIQRLKEGEYVGLMTYTLLQDLVNNDVIKPGKYIIDVSW